MNQDVFMLLFRRVRN